MSENSGSFSVQVDASINHICNELKLISFVRAKCIEMSGKIKPKQGVNITKPIANAIACAVVSIVHEESKRRGRVARHLPDRIIGKVFGLNSIAVVYNKHLINSVISGDSAKMAKITG
jgi:hypothetical protein